MVRADEDDILGRDIDDGTQKRTKTSGRPIPPAPRVTKVEVLSEDEGDDDEEDESEEDEDDEVTAVSAIQPSQPRNEVDPKVAFRQNAVYVYGLDFLKTGHMEEIFSQFNHKFIEWINDSSANVVFKNAESAKTALESLSFPKKDDEPWRRTPDILVSEDVPPIFLQMRLATACDAKRGRKSAAGGMPYVNYPPSVIRPQAFGRGRGGRGGRGGRRRMYADGTGSEKPLPAATAKVKPQPGTRRMVVTEEEERKRQKRKQRFGEAAEPEVIADDSAPQQATHSDANASKAAAGSEPAETQQSSEKNSDAPVSVEEKPAAEATKEPAPAAEKAAVEATEEPPAEAPAPDQKS